MATPTCTAFDGTRLLAAGPLTDITPAIKYAIERSGPSPILVFDDTTGRQVDIDVRDTQRVAAALGKKLAVPEAAVPELPTEPKKRGRPKLGVVAREVTLLPRHWDWLSSQPGGASVALRKLVEDARKKNGDRDHRRAAQAAAYQFMSAIAGNFENFEEAARALFADDRRRFSDLVAGWPADVRDHAIKLAFADLSPDQ